MYHYESDRPFQTTNYHNKSSSGHCLVNISYYFLTSYINILYIIKHYALKDVLHLALLMISKLETISNISYDRPGKFII